MDKNYAKDLFQLQSELVDRKVDTAMTNAIERIMHEINSLRQDMQKEMHAMKHELHTEINALRRDMDQQFASLRERVTAVEATLVYVRNSQTQISTKFIDYTFKAGWLLLAGSISYMITQLV